VVSDVCSQPPRMGTGCETAASHWPTSSFLGPTLQGHLVVAWTTRATPRVIFPSQFQALPRIFCAPPLLPN
jgi:hypothetical protein